MKESREFDWDRHNEQHLTKHGISRSDAEDVLSGSHILLEYQTEGDEQRWVAVGATRMGRILSIVFAIRQGAMHPITGWPADKETADLYVKEWGWTDMAKAKLKDLVIPKFSSEGEEAAWWNNHRSKIEAAIRQRVKQKRPLTLGNLLQGSKPSQPITLRIPKDDLEIARRLAAKKGLGYQTYIKMLLREALAEKARRG